MKRMDEIFVPMHSVIPEGEAAGVKVSHFTVTEDDVRLENMRNAFTPGGSMYHISAGTYARLHVNGRLYMTDTQMERRTNIHFVRNATGDVLIAGLGLGLIVVPLLSNDSVRSVTVIERTQGVIDLIEPHLRNPKLTVICADIFEWRPAKGTKYDAIYFDIWPDVCTSNLDEIAKLHQAFKFYVNRENPNVFMDSWQRDHLKYQRQADRRSSYRYAW